MKYPIEQLLQRAEDQGSFAAMKEVASRYTPFDTVYQAVAGGSDGRRAIYGRKGDERAKVMATLCIENGGEPLLKKALKHGNYKVRTVAVHTLFRVDPEKACSQALLLLRKEPSTLVRAKCVQKLFERGLFTLQDLHRFVIHPDISLAQGIVAFIKNNTISCEGLGELYPAALHNRVKGDILSLLLEKDPIQAVQCLQQGWIPNSATHYRYVAFHEEGSDAQQQLCKELLSASKVVQQSALRLVSTIHLTQARPFLNLLLEQGQWSHALFEALATVMEDDELTQLEVFAQEHTSYVAPVLNAMLQRQLWTHAQVWERFVASRRKEEQALYLRSLIEEYGDIVSAAVVMQGNLHPSLASVATKSLQKIISEVP